MPAQTIPEALARLCAEEPLFDTHEHLMPRDRIAEGRVGLADLLRHSYVSWATGAVEGDGREDWRDALRRVRHRAFYTTWLDGMRDLYGFAGDLDAATWARLDEQVGANYESPDWERRVLVDRCRISQGILDPYWDHLTDQRPAEVFSACLRINPLVFGFHERSLDHNAASAHRLAAAIGFELREFADYEPFCRELIRSRKRAGAPCLKSALAYDRDLFFARRRRDDAARVWGKHPADVTPEEKLAFGDYVVDLLARIAGEESLPFQWHTGLGEHGGSDPMKLMPLIERHPDTKFVLLHGGYPWTSQWAYLGMALPNVWLDLTWLPTISPRLAVRALDEALDVVNADRLCAGGGDSWTVEGAHAALLAGRQVVAQALTRRVRRDDLSVKDASDTARGLLRTNAEALYGGG